MFPNFEEAFRLGLAIGLGWHVSLLCYWMVDWIIHWIFNIEVEEE